MRSDALVRVELLLCNLRKTALRSARLHFSNHWAVLALAVFWLWGAREPLFIGVLLLMTAVLLTVCFGVAAWRIADEPGVEITGQIPHQSYGLKPTSR
jgi:hypothetical protein